MKKRLELWLHSTRALLQSSNTQSLGAPGGGAGRGTFQLPKGAPTLFKRALQSAKGAQKDDFLDFSGFSEFSAFSAFSVFSGFSGCFGIFGVFWIFMIFGIFGIFGFFGIFEIFVPREKLEN